MKNRRMKTRRMIGFTKKSPEHRAALDRVRAWTRARFALPGEAAIVVAQLACGVPGCPPVETAVAFWADEKRHHFKIFKPVAQVTEDDLPFAWLKDALVVPEGFGCDCC
jgi:nitrate reductase delta subunit